MHSCQAKRLSKEAATFSPLPAPSNYSVAYDRYIDLKRALRVDHFPDVMDTNALIDIVYEVQGQLWVDKVNETHRTGRLCQWVSTFHPDNLPCKLYGTFHHGAFNAGMKMVFSDNAWMVRFPRVGMVSDEYADEKVAMEVSALKLIRSRTTIPVPIVHAWGLAASNSLRLGPVIMMDFIDGVSLCDILKDPRAEHPTRLMREDISDSDIELIYRQLANYLLQLFGLDFHQIGSLPWPEGEAKGATQQRPLTFKAHCILHNGGVNTFGDRCQGFTSTGEYFQYVLEQDWKQLVQQPNSIVGRYDAKNKYVAFKTLKALVCQLVHAQYGQCRFKLICDDLGLANLIVRSKEGLTVVGVVDLEWSYIRPASCLARHRGGFFKTDLSTAHGIIKMANQPELPLEEEEAKMPEHEGRELSRLMKWSQASGAMWLHMLILFGFNDHRSFPFTQLRQHLANEWQMREEEFKNEDKLEAFAARKVRELDEYDEALDKREDEKALVDKGVMTMEEFITNAFNEPGASPSNPSSSSTTAVDDVARKDKGLFHKVAA